MSQVNKSRIPLTDNSIIEQVGQTVIHPCSALFPDSLPLRFWCAAMRDCKLMRVAVAQKFPHHQQVMQPFEVVTGLTASAHCLRRLISVAHACRRSGSTTSSALRT